MNLSNLHHIGNFDVDAGLCWIGDPCYILHREDGLPEELGKNWYEFCDKINQNVNIFRNGLAIRTLWGDGTYPVYAKYQDGRVSQLVIDFDGSEDLDA